MSYLWKIYVYAIILCKTHLHAYFRGVKSIPPNYKITRVLLISDDVIQDITSKMSTKIYEGLLVGYISDHTTNTRVEIRYLFKGRKYRILHLLDPTVFRISVPWPPYPSKLKSQGFRRKIIGAITTSTAGRVKSVTDRVQKYAGPLGDFHRGVGYLPRLSWVFPHGLQVPYCDHVLLLDSFGKQYQLDYEEDPCLPYM